MLIELIVLTEKLMILMELIDIWGNFDAVGA